MWPYHRAVWTIIGVDFIIAAVYFAGTEYILRRKLARKSAVNPRPVPVAAAATPPQRRGTGMESLCESTASVHPAPRRTPSPGCGGVAAAATGTGRGFTADLRAVYGTPVPDAGDLRAAAADRTAGRVPLRGEDNGIRNSHVPASGLPKTPAPTYPKINAGPQLSQNPSSNSSVRLW